MLRDFSNQLFRHLIEVFPPDRSYGRAAFEQGNMPQPITHFLARKLQQHLDKEVEQLRTVRSPWIDYAHPEVQDAEHAFAGVLATHAQIPQEAWAATLREAVERVTAYLVNPVETLVDFTFEEPGPLPVSTLQERLGCFTAYPYLREVVGAYFKQKKLQEIDRERFAALLGRIDREMTRDYSAAAWIRLLAPLFSLADALPDARSGVPVPLLHTFFDAKGLEGIQRRLRTAGEQGRSTLSQETLQQLLESPSAPVETPPAPQPAPARSPQPPASSPTQPKSVPLWRQFQQSGPSLPGEGSMPPAPAPERGRSNTGRVPEKGARPLWMQFQPHAAPPAPPSEPRSSGLTALERSVLGTSGPQNRDLFVKHLFSGSTDAYEQVLRRLHETASWTEASQIIAQEVFRKHQVNIYSDPAVSFTDAVETQYRRR